MEVVDSLSQGRTAAAQCGLFTHKSVPVIFEPPCTWSLYFRSSGFGGNYLFSSQHISHTLSKIKHMRLRNFAVSLSIFQLPRHFNNPMVRSQAA